MTELMNLSDEIEVRSFWMQYGPGESGGEEKSRCGWHRFYYFPKAGCRLTVEEDIYEPKAGELYLIPAGTLCGCRFDPEEPTERYICCFDLYLGEGRKLCYLRDAVCCRPDQHRTEELLKKIHTIRENTLSLHLICRAAFLELLALFLERRELPLIEDVQRDEFECRISSYVDSHLAERITVKELADTVHLQPGYFIQRFKKSFHTTPISYVNRIRLEYTVRRMTGCPEEKLEEIARIAGFEDYRYFSRLFKREYGMPPSVYRELGFGIDSLAGTGAGVVNIHEKKDRRRLIC